MESASPRIGILSAFWLPKFGGGEQYVYRMTRGLIARGLDVRVFCGTGQRAGYDNGTGSVTRFVPKGDLEFAELRTGFSERTPGFIKAIVGHFAWFNEAVDWCRKNKINAVIICNPFQQMQCFHARELYTRLQDAGIKVGLVHHDLPPPIEQFLQQIYRSDNKSWDEVSSYVLSELSKALRAKPGMEGYWEIGSPLVFNPDFVISNSDWVLRFIDPLKTKRQFVFHGPIDAEYWRKSLTDDQKLAPKDVLMINPQNRKGPSAMRDLIIKDKAGTTFRVLKGGWGDSFKTFKPQVSDSLAVRQNRVEFLDYVKDMRTVYAAAGVVFFPSHYEGYGLAAVEPMFLGTPVVSSNYPAILEAVGEGAKTLCPLKNTPEDWSDAIVEVLKNREEWSARALARAEAHIERQDKQTAELAKFLIQVAE